MLFKFKTTIKFCTGNKINSFSDRLLEISAEVLIFIAYYCREILKFDNNL